MIAKRITAAVLASALLFSPIGAMAQETGGTAEGEIETPFGSVSPVVAGIAAVVLVTGIVVVATGGNNSNFATSTATATAPSTAQ